MKTKENYLNDLKARKPDIYCLGIKIDNPVEHPILRAPVASMSETYALASSPDNKDPFVAVSHLTGEEINRYTHVCMSREDLIQRVRLARLLQHRICSCAYRCMGCGAINALYSVSYDIDDEMGTEYHPRLLEYLKYVQKNDLAITSGITDVKGDRGLRPSEQVDPDMFVRIVEERTDGVILRGAKVHQSGAPFADEVLILPTIAMRKEDKNYAIAAAVPADAPGVTHIYQHNMYDSRRLISEDMDLGNSRFGYGYGTSLMVLEDVFVSWDRVFLCTEYAFTGLLMERLGSSIRATSGACRAGQAELILGAAATLAEYNGVEIVPHVRDKLAHMSYLVEKVYGCALASAMEGKPSVSGAWYHDNLMANVALFAAKDALYQVAQLGNEVAGGLTVTMPSEKDFRHSFTGPLVEKYLRGRAGIPTEHRIRVFRFLEGLIASPMVPGQQAGAGLPAVQMKVIEKSTDFEYKKNLAKRLAGVEILEREP